MIDAGGDVFFDERIVFDLHGQGFVKDFQFVHEEAGGDPDVVFISEVIAFGEEPEGSVVFLSGAVEQAEIEFSFDFFSAG